MVGFLGQNVAVRLVIFIINQNYEVGFFDIENQPLDGSIFLKTNTLRILPVCPKERIIFTFTHTTKPASPAMPPPTLPDLDSSFAELKTWATEVWSVGKMGWKEGPLRGCLGPLVWLLSICVNIYIYREDDTVPIYIRDCIGILWDYRGYIGDEWNTTQLCGNHYKPWNQDAPPIMGSKSFFSWLRCHICSSRPAWSLVENSSLSSTWLITHTQMLNVWPIIFTYIFR